MRTLHDLLLFSQKFLKKNEIPDPRKTAEEIIAHALQSSRMDIYLQYDMHIDTAKWHHCLKLLKRKASGEPLEYIFRNISFSNCRLTITPDVLIPRQETEILFYKICETLSKNENKIQKAWDICTGSGCLGLGLKKNFPGLDVSLSDISSKCLEVAKKNAMRNQLDVHFFEGDLLVPFKGEKADVIICNPPYVSLSEYEVLDASVKMYEPRLALVSGETGFEFYERLAKELPAYLNPQAKVFLEIGTGQGLKLLEIFHQACWKSKRYEKDWAGHDRFFFLEFEEESCCIA